MAAFAIDVTNTRVRQAMDFLGIEDSELAIKSQADFAGPHVSPEIQKLRFDYHTKKITETVRKIKHRMKEERMRQSLGSAGNSMTSMRAATSRVQLKSATLTSFMQYEESKLARLKDKQKEKILEALSSFKQDKEVVKPNPAEQVKKAAAAEQLQEELEKKREALAKRKKRHEDKLQSIQEERKAKQQELMRNLKKSMREHEEREKRHEENKHKEVRERALSLQMKQTEVAQKLSAREAHLEMELMDRLADIEERINRNRKIHEEKLKETAENAAKAWNKAETNVQQIDALRDEKERERIREYAAAQKRAWARKDEIDKEQQEKYTKEREAIEKKLASIREKQKKQRQDQYETMKKVEARMSQTNRVLEKRQKDWNKQLELRQELQRLHDEDKRTKVERAQRIYVSYRQNLKRMKLIEKQQQDREKIETLKREHQLRLAKQHETAIKMMIEKERGTELHKMVLKSPTSKIIQDKLKSLDIKLAPEPEAVEAQ